MSYYLYLGAVLGMITKSKIATATTLATISHVVYRRHIMSSEGCVPTKERRQLNYSKLSLTCEKLSQVEWSQAKQSRLLLRNGMLHEDVIKTTTVMRHGHISTIWTVYEERTLKERTLASAGGVERERGARIQVLEGSASAVGRAYAHFSLLLTLDKCRNYEEKWIKASWDSLASLVKLSLSLFCFAPRAA